ncbi:MAG: MerR family transcriptional regulator [Acidimicrobiales bacterium]
MAVLTPSVHRSLHELLQSFEKWVVTSRRGVPGGRPGRGRRRHGRRGAVYQSKGLLPPPRHQGRVAIYSARHWERSRTIRGLKSQGHSLKVIATMLARPAAGTRYREAVLGNDGEDLTLARVAERARVPPSPLRSLEASGLLRPLKVGEAGAHDTGADVRAALQREVSGRRLDAGLPA